MADAGDDPQSGLSAHLLNLEADGAPVPDQPAEGGEPEATAETIVAIEEALFDNSADEEAPTEAAASPQAGSERYQGEGVYVGHEPPEGFTIKGNERSMKYHMPESSGYGRTVAEVWFNSEEAAQLAGFIRAQR
jgi:hypothetical protein